MSKARGKLITFYSYKGGTGRSMALANVAWILASNGKRVLVVDWDLEAPGLHRYFSPFLIDKELIATDGVMDLINKYAMAALTPPDKAVRGEGRWYDRYADVTRYSVSLDWKFLLEGGGRGALDFIPAGRQSESYSFTVNTFDWQNFYERLGGGAFLDAVREEMLNNYDYVLIDSRTGLSDTSGICTVQMPDALVICFTLNNQSIIGASAVAKFVLRQRDDASVARKGIDIFPLPTRIEFAEKEMLEEMRNFARGKFVEFPNRLSDGSSHESYWEDIKIPYVPYYAYQEILAAFGDRSKDIYSILGSMERLTFHLTDGAVSKLVAPPEMSAEEVRALYAGGRIKVSDAEAQDRVGENAYARLSDVDKTVARRALLRLVAAGREEEVRGDKRRRVPLSAFDAASQTVLSVLRESRVVTIERDEKGGQEFALLASDDLLQHWRRLREWIEEGRNLLLWRQQSEFNVERWIATRNDSLLLHGAELNIGELYFTERFDELTSNEKEYLQASLQRYRREQERERAEKERAERERTEKERAEREEIERQRLQNLQDVSASYWQRLRKRLGFEFSTTTPDDRSGTQDGFRDMAASALVGEARAILRGTYRNPRELLSLAKKLKRVSQFNYARRILARARKELALSDDPALRLQIYQQSALCTYKDSDLPADARLDRALEILQEVEDISRTRDPETLGLVGAIYKRKWEVDSQKSQLERSLFYYLRGYAVSATTDQKADQGYNGINAAFVLDLIAHQEENEATKAGATAGEGVIERIATRREQAREIRHEVADKIVRLVELPETNWLQGEWWFYSTVAEALFGLGAYDAAVTWLERGREAVSCDVHEWEYEATVRQFAALARLQAPAWVDEKDLEGTPPWRALERFAGMRAPIRGAFIGKIGLGLSGGGFRASLYHIGVLAKLAELDILRHVEVLSCVSGGSIIGTHYYLEVRKLLEEKSDQEITRGDYVEIIKRIQRDFLTGVQRNIRTRVTTENISNLKMFLHPLSYSRTLRVGELYERELFSRVLDGEGYEPRFINELYIRPKGEGSGFRPRQHNWRRDAKAPVLILNATTLNTGHAWHFTASYMGEPPGRGDSVLDSNDHLRRMYYEEAPEGYRNVRLGHAVAASSCVPGLFEPLVFAGLYPDRDVLLVDGGVCDNQGIGGLLEQDCNVILISDGSGQMTSENRPSRGMLGVPLRSNAILQARLRETQYQDLSARRRAQLLRGLMFVHLKKDLDADTVDWVECLDPYDADDDDARPASRRGTLTRYGISKDIQKLLASVRTDLDSFSDVEAYALMTSGYRMTEYNIKESKAIEWADYIHVPEQWDFLMVEDAMKGVGRPYMLMRRLLGVSGLLAFKIWKLNRSLQFMAWLMGGAFFLFMFWAGWVFHDSVIIQAPTVGAVMMFIITVLLTALGIILVSKVIFRIDDLRTTLFHVVVGFFMAFLGSFFAWIHLHFFDGLYLREGSLERFKRVSKQRSR
jgi:MinD-like ATPase involved in chromosome partitioning or flagellar assembly/predicted acylesterase/phospholipase RssA